jgi:putative NIF3 family GTP cyclohydrolase 1 type 2
MTKTANYGLGKIGTLEDAMSLTDFVKLYIEHLGYQVHVSQILQSLLMTSHLLKCQFCQDLGYEALAFNKGADIFITGDVKHHDALDAQTYGMTILDIDSYFLDMFISIACISNTWDIKFMFHKFYKVC